MVFATLAGIGFMIQGAWIEALLAIGYIVFCLLGNRRLERKYGVDE
jgi:hypothetical protein